MRHLVVLWLAVLAVTAGCAGNESNKKESGSASPAPTTDEDPGSAQEPVARRVEPKPEPTPGPAPSQAPTDAPPPGHDFTAAAQALFVIAACGDGALPPGVPAAVVNKHCKSVKAAQAEYHATWVTKARAFFAEKVPEDIPKKVVYPFAGGDLSTALTVYPDADEITTMSLEPAGDPRTLAALTARPAAAGTPAKPAPAKPAPAKATPLKPTPAKRPVALVTALETIESELKFLYRVNFSNTMNMIGAMRGGQLPTQLTFGLSALKVHGYEIVSLRYFKLDADGNIVYLTDADVAKAPDPTKGMAQARNRIFANAEIRFRKPNGRTQIYRHIQVNLGDNDPVGALRPLKEDPRVLKHLEAKGQVAGMTKAASYLLSWEAFSRMREYLTKHVVWMVSDATGVAPKWGKPAGFEYETYGSFNGPHMPAGLQIAKNWKDEFAAQQKRALPFRFGYHDSKRANTLVIMKRKKG